MKPLVFASLVLTFFVVEACASTQSSRSTPPLPPPPPPPPAAVSAPVVPTPAPAPAQPERTLPLVDGMERVSDADLEGSLEKWADGKDIDLGHVIKRTSVFLEVAPIIKWDDNKKRERDVADHDRLVRDSIDQATALVAAARAGKTDQIKPLSDRLIQTCVDCHTKYK